MKIAKIISGGQTGADIAGVKAGYDLKIPTGGTAPKGFRTEFGSNPGLATYGIVEHSSWYYPPRTEKNVKDADVTIIFGDDNSAGSKLTKKYCHKHSKKCLLVREFSHAEYVNCYRALDENCGYNLIINVAGNTETHYPGIEKLTRAFLKKLFKELQG